MLSRRPPNDSDQRQWCLLMVRGSNTRSASLWRCVHFCPSLRSSRTSKRWTLLVFRREIMCLAVVVAAAAMECGMTRGTVALRCAVLSSTLRALLRWATCVILADRPHLVQEFLEVQWDLLVQAPRQ